MSEKDYITRSEYDKDISRIESDFNTVNTRLDSTNIKVENNKDNIYKIQHEVTSIKYDTKYNSELTSREIEGLKVLRSEKQSNLTRIVVALISLLGTLAVASFGILELFIK